MHSGNLWNPDYAFSDFTKISMCMVFQGILHVCDFYPVRGSDETNIRHGFSWNDYSTDGARRIIAGKLSFSGRYINYKDLSMSYNLGAWQALDASYITITKIIGYP